MKYQRYTYLNAEIILFYDQKRMILQSAQKLSSYVDVSD